MVIGEYGIQKTFILLYSPWTDTYNIGLALGLIFFGNYLDGQMPTIMAGMIGLAGIFVSFIGIILY
ncbi:MAG: hypothetical protein A4E26_00880 [Methanobacterium sp. PtaU1.Bin097]|jgi:hypothetical protein|nr:MAG: hypothetical protein A4E26_00880 [Methanobacterium sp. PtaU1.Bin097]